MDKFIGRQEELKRLQDTARVGPALIVIRGRRRIGKSRLVQEYAKDKRFLEFSAESPSEDTSAQDQRDSFSNQLVHQLKISPCTFKNWYDAFIFLSNNLTDEPTVIFFDEISWMAVGDPSFVPKLKVWWDTKLQHFKNLQLILCSSISTWLEENIINTTALFGRISLQLTLDELSLPESYEFLKTRGFKGSNYDILKILSITGGVPWYLKQIDPQLLADENIKRLCFTEGGLLTLEFERIFSDLYGGYWYVDTNNVISKSKYLPRAIATNTIVTGYNEEVCKRIVLAVADGMKNLADLREELGYAHGGYVGKHVRNLCVAGFITQHNTWSFKTKKIGKQSLYRLSDNYLRFYIKHIAPNLNKIKKNAYADLSLEQLPGWHSIMGYQVENLLLKNRKMILQAIGIRPEEVIDDNPYVQTATKRHKGCQVDYLIQTQTNNLFLCEIKFNKRELGLEIIEEVKTKIDKLTVPRGYSAIPVLINFAGVNGNVDEKSYFYRIINLNDILEVEVKY